MALIYWGEVDAAGDITMAAIINTSDSQTRTAIIDLITPIAAGIISGNPAVAAAAAAAVAAALADARLVGLVVVASAGGQATDLNLIDTSRAVMLDIRNSALNRPVSNGWHFVGWHVPNLALGIATQWASSPTSNRMWMRSRSGGSWGGWAELAIPQRSAHIESGELILDAPNAPTATHYLLPDHTGELVARTSAFPIPSASAPELTW